MYTLLHAAALHVDQSNPHWIGRRWSVDQIQWVPLWIGYITRRCEEWRRSFQAVTIKYRATDVIFIAHRMIGSAATETVATSPTPDTACGGGGGGCRGCWASTASRLSIWLANRLRRGWSRQTRRTRGHCRHDDRLTSSRQGIMVLLELTQGRNKSIELHHK